MNFAPCIFDREAEVMVKTVTLPIRIEPSCGQTLQDQIYFCIRRSIVNGSIHTDGRLPSTRTLAADLGVSRTTVLLAFEQLKAEGYADAGHLSGRSVRNQLTRVIAARKKKP